MTATKNVVIIELSLENCYLVGGGELTFGVDKNFVGVGGGGGGLFQVGGNEQIFGR